MLHRSIFAEFKERAKENRRSTRAGDKAATAHGELLSPAHANNLGCGVVVAINL